MSEMENNSEPKLSRDEWEEMFFDASDAKIEIQEPKGKPKYDPIDWDALGDNERRCKNCDHWREENGLGDFICRNIRGYKEAPVHIRRCDNCNEWKKEKGIGGDFWHRIKISNRRATQRCNVSAFFYAKICSLLARRRSSQPVQRVYWPENVIDWLGKWRLTCVMRHARGQKLQSFRRKWPFYMNLYSMLLVQT